MDDLRALLSGQITDKHVLSSTFEIENILLVIEEIEKKLEHYKELKRQRVKSIDEKVSSLNAKQTMLRQVILNTMTHMNEKSLDFPDIGKVSRRKSRATLVMEDQDSVLNYLDKKGLKDHVVKTVETVDKRKLNSLVNDLEKQGEVVPGVSKSQGSETVSISFEKPTDPNSGAPIDAPSKAELDLEDLDALIV